MYSSLINLPLVNYYLRDVAILEWKKRASERRQITWNRKWNILDEDALILLQELKSDCPTETIGESFRVLTDACLKCEESHVFGPASPTVIGSVNKEMKMVEPSVREAKSENGRRDSGSVYL